MKPLTIRGDALQAGPRPSAPPKIASPARSRHRIECEQCGQQQQQPHDLAMTRSPIEMSDDHDAAGRERAEPRGGDQECEQRRDDAASSRENRRSERQAMPSRATVIGSASRARIRRPAATAPSNRVFRGSATDPAAGRAEQFDQQPIPQRRARPRRPWRSRRAAIRGVSTPLRPGRQAERGGNARRQLTGFRARTGWAGVAARKPSSARRPSRASAMAVRRPTCHQ